MSLYEAVFFVAAVECTAGFGAAGAVKVTAVLMMSNLGKLFSR
jgi:hypothetical protein